MKLLLYSKENCSLCEQALVLLQILQQDYSFEVEEVDIYQDEALLESYHLMIPVIAHHNTIIDSGMIDLSTVENYMKRHHKIENS